MVYNAQNVAAIALCTVTALLAEWTTSFPGMSCELQSTSSSRSISGKEWHGGGGVRGGGRRKRGGGVSGGAAGGGGAPKAVMWSSVEAWRISKKVLPFLW